MSASSLGLSFPEYLWIECQPVISFQWYRLLSYSCSDTILHESVLFLIHLAEDIVTICLESKCLVPLSLPVS